MESKLVGPVHHESHLPLLGMSARVIGVGQTTLGKLGLSASSLMRTALQAALADAGLGGHEDLKGLSAIDGLVAVPSLSHVRFMEAHCVATETGLLPKKNTLVRTVNLCGAGPVSGLLMADQMIRHEGCHAVALVAGDAVGSLDSKEFLRRADAGPGLSDPSSALPSPVIPKGFNRVAEYQMQKYGLTREQLAMVAVLMSRQAVRHPLAVTKSPYTLEEVLSSQTIASSTTIKECARKTDGGAAIILASDEFINAHGLRDKTQAPAVVGGGEGSGPMYPPETIDESMFSTAEAVQRAYSSAGGLAVKDIDFFGLYDCFPICFIRAVEAVGLAPVGRGGSWVEERYRESETGGGVLSPDRFPVNTHGGLLGFGAPWETPAMYNIIEAVHQMRRSAGAERQIQGDVNAALVYGNGGIFASTAVAILSKEGRK